MAVRSIFVLMCCVAFTLRVYGDSNCPKNCTCNILDDTTSAVQCGEQFAQELQEKWPEKTSKLDLSRSKVSTIEWSVLASLDKLNTLVLTSNVNCNCDYYNYWKKHIGPDADRKVSIKGKCTQPSSRKGLELSTAGADMTLECDVRSTPSLTKTSAFVMATKQPTKSSFQKQVEPTPTSQTRVAVSSQVKETKPMETSDNIMPSTSSANPHSTKLVAPHPVAPAPVSTSSKGAVDPSKSTTTAMAPASKLFPMTPKATIETTTTPPPPTEETTEETTAENVVTETPEETTTQKPTISPKPGLPSVSLYLQDSDVKIGSVADVFCQVDGIPKAEVSITYNGQDARQIPGMFYERYNGAKIVFEAKFTSEVICSAKNKFGERKDTLRVPVKQSSISYFMVMLKLFKEKYTEDYRDHSSAKFQNLQKRLNTEFENVFTQFYGFYGISLVSVQSGSVIVNVLVKTTNSTRSRAKKIVEDEVKQAKLGNIPVDRYFYSFQDKEKVCGGEYLNVTWSDTMVNNTVFEKCPQGAKGFARRNCTVNGWYYPDYTRCESAPFTEAKKQMRSATDGSSNSPSMDILLILKNLKNMSVPFKDESHIAGDLIVCIDIVEMLANYTKLHRNDIAFNDQEAQLVVDVTSNVLSRNHEQELIVSQKLIQKASTLIRVVEQYGLQAAVAVSNNTDGLKFFLADNAVMGCGVVQPLTITKDITFPNYDIPEIDEIRSKWHASSFINIDKEIIEDLTKVKRFRVAGFLYRTLTRVLSAESAYSMVGQGYEINSAVVSLTLDPPLPSKLKTPVIIASNNLKQVQLEEDSPICAFWDFKLNEPNGGWSEKGCWYTHYNTHNTTCLCEHLTNFAVLKEKPVYFPPLEQRQVVVFPPFLLCLLIGCIIMICFCAITLVLLLIFGWRMRPDRTWGMHIFVCAVLITAFALIIVGLYKYNDDLFFCRLFSMLVHYFYLCGLSWIMAEATYMFVWTTTHGPKQRYWIGYFFLGFVPPGIPLVVAWLIQGMQNFESLLSCWMSLLTKHLWVFFVPAVIFLLATFLIFRKVWKTATGNLRVPLKATYWRTRFRVHVRYSIAIQILLILTWLCGLLVITYHATSMLQLIFCILFIIFCAITGLVILVFYCIADREFEDAFRECCCLCCYRGKYEVKEREDLWAEQQQEVDEAPVAQAELVHAERQSFAEEEQQHDPLIKYVTRKAPASEPSMSSIEDPLYERVKQPGEEPMVVAEEEKPKEEEPVYAKIYREEVPEEQDPFPVAQPGSPRFLRGLTRMEVIRMAKKSDAAKAVLKKYESPKGSTDDIAEHPTYLLNQEELDEELRHFRTFFSESKESSPKPSTSTTPPGTPTLSPIPRTYSAASSSSSTTKTTRIVKASSTKTTTASATTFGKTGESQEKSFVSHESYESSSSFHHETTTTRVPIRGASPDFDSPPAIPPKCSDILEDDEEDDEPSRKDSDAKVKLLDVEKDDESLTDVSAADFERDSSSDEEGSSFLDGSRPTAV